jgi:hypothetical protein
MDRSFGLAGGLPAAACLLGSCIYHDLDAPRTAAWSAPVRAPSAAAPAIADGPQIDPARVDPAIGPAIDPAAGDDFLARRMEELRRTRAEGRPPLSDLQRATLGTSEVQDFNIELVAGGCYTVIGVGVPQVTDLDLFLFDPAGAQVAVDTDTNNVPVVAHCAGASGVFRVQAKVYSGAGEFAVQLFGTDGDPARAATPPAAGAFPPPDPSGDPLERRMAELYARFGERRAPVSALMRGSLGRSRTQDFALTLQAGHCYTAIAASDPSLTDLDMYVFDPAGAELGQDRATDNFPVVRSCPNATGRHRIRVEAYSGSGNFALQVYGAGAPSRAH